MNLELSWLFRRDLNDGTTHHGFADCMICDKDTYALVYIHNLKKSQSEEDLAAGRSCSDAIVHDDCLDWIGLRISSRELHSVETVAANKVEPFPSKLHVDCDVARRDFDLAKKDSFVIPDIDRICHATVDIASIVSLDTVWEAGVGVSEQCGDAQCMAADLERVHSALSVEV
jgi:hypothetical protein